MTPLLLLLPTPTLGFVAQAHALHAPSHTSHTPVMHLPAPVSSLCLTSLCAIAAEPSSVGMTGGNMDPGTAAIVSTYITATTAGLIVTAFTAPMLMGALGEISLGYREAMVSQEGDANDDDVCELVPVVAPGMHNAGYETEVDELWLCPGMTLDDPRCREIFHNGELTVACAF